MIDFRNYNKLPLAKKPNEVVEASFGIIFFLAIFVIPLGSYAENIYYQDIITGEIGNEVWPDSVFTKIGEITTPAGEPFLITAGQAVFEFKNISGFCHAEPHFRIGIATSSAETSFIASSEAVVNVDEEYHRHTVSFSGENYLMPSTTYDVVSYMNCGAMAENQMFVRSFGGQFFGILTDDGGFSELLPDLYTRFYYLDPSNSEVVATSTSNDFYADLYLAEEDHEVGMFVRFSYVRQQDLQAAVANTDLLWTSIDLDDIITSGYNFLSTTTGHLGLDGTYYFKAELRRDPAWYDTALTWIGLDMFATDYVIASTTTFVYGEMTQFDKFVASTTQNIADYTASTTLDFETAQNACFSISGFDFSDCMNFVFGWQQIPMSNAMNNIKDNFFTYVPFGYITRAYEIFATTSTSTLPTISYTFPADFPVDAMASVNFHFDPWDYFYKDGAPVKEDLVSSGGKDVWDIFEPVIKIIVYLTLFWMVVRELLEIKYSAHSKDNL